MTAYFIIHINVTNKENYELYKNKVTPIVEKFRTGKRNTSVLRPVNPTQGVEKHFITLHLRCG